MPAPKPLLESNKIEPATPRPPYSQIGIHNHVSLNLHFNNQHQQQQQKLVPNSTSVPSTNSEPKIHSERFIESIVQSYNDNQQQQQQQRTSTHPHTIEYFHQSSPSKSSSQIFTKPTTNASVNILSSREQTTSTSFLQNKPQVTPTRIASAADRVLPAFHTFSELKSYLQTIGLDVELVPASSTNPPQQPKVVMLPDGPAPPVTTSRPEESKCVPPSVLTEKLLEYTSSMRRSPSKAPIVSEIANLLSISASKDSTPIVQQVTRHPLLPPPPPPPPSTSNNSTRVKTDLIHDDPHLHDREVEELMNGGTSKTRKTAPEKSIVIESGSASNSNDSHVSSNSSNTVSNHSTGNANVHSAKQHRNLDANEQSQFRDE